MRILLAALGTAGDVHPFLALGRALTERGHDVQLATNAHFAPAVERAGLPFEAIGAAERYQHAISGPGIFTAGPSGMQRLFDCIVNPSIRPLYNLIRGLHAERPLVVAASSLCFGARIAQDHLGVPTASIHMQSTLLRGAADLPSLPDWLGVGTRRRLLPLIDRVADMSMAGPVNALRRELGLPPARRILGVWMHSPLRVIGLFPPWYAAPQPDWPPSVRLTGFLRYDAGDGQGPSKELEAFLAAGEPPIVFTAGTGMAQAERFFAESAGACGQLGARGILLTSHREQTPTGLPGTVRQVDYAPFAELLPRCASIVHHGGIGTIAQGLAAGIPQLVVPWAFDQPDGAARIRRLGLGDHLSPKAYNPSSAATMLHRLLNAPEIAEKCRALAGRVAEGDPLVETCGEIEALG